eukprot:CAMPEP_0168748206 /NCGR_PEP_ID=MMETSP0724-20121128/16055_1 /TAXON_ID=265536 /ORGANISM="Amphiprora sp., Strain CCMP467" /LENGTH=574 /DNA_ID=CAMNT_0008796025 /DNA_START=199 /DNA_END=1924 /DNA_ORIENTATION=+
MSKPGPHRIAIIGGGVGWFELARRIGEQTSQENVQVTVFDTGRLRPGGRLSSRLPADPPKEGVDNENYTYLNRCILDHAAQIIAVPSSQRTDMHEFTKQLQQWEEQDVIQSFPPGSLSNIVKGNDDAPENTFRLQPFSSSSNNDENTASSFYHGKKGNGAIPLAMASTMDFDLVQDCWVSPGNGARYVTNRQGDGHEWKLQAKGRVLGYFDQLVIAHNGKCADRLTSQTPAKDINQLLRVNFASSCPAWGGRKMTLNSLYSLSFAVGGTTPSSSASLEQALPDPFIAGFVQNQAELRFLSCASRKYPSDILQRDQVQVWTLLSSPTFAKQHKAPQEFIPQEKAEEVTDLLLRALESSLGLESNSIRPIESKLQLWGAAVPLNIWKSSAPQPQPQQDERLQSSNGAGFLYDSQHSVGVCGDWLVESSVAGAWTSGYQLANHIVSSTIPLSSTSHSEPLSIGLQGAFERSDSVHRGGIASFGDDKNNKKAKNGSGNSNNNNSKRRHSNRKKGNGGSPNQKQQNNSARGKGNRNKTRLNEGRPIQESKSVETSETRTATQPKSRAYASISSSTDTQQ